MRKTSKTLYPRRTSDRNRFDPNSFPDHENINGLLWNGDKSTYAIRDKFELIYLSCVCDYESKAERLNTDSEGISSKMTA